MADQELEQQQEAIEDAIAEAVWPGMCTGWILLAEVVDEEGARRLVRVCDREMTKWAYQGYLCWALNEPDSEEDL